MEKRGQVTIFIIIAVVVVGLAVLIYNVIPETSTDADIDTDNPEGFLQTCLENHIEETVEIISLQGGSLIIPEHNVSYQGNKIGYLCYTSEDYATCAVQKPFLKNHIEEEIKIGIEDEALDCFRQMQTSFQERGYEAVLNEGNTRIELLPKRIVANFDNYVLTLTRGETQRYDSFDVVLNNNLYELLSIAENIIDHESEFGDVDPSLYMGYYGYSQIKVEKRIFDDGSTVYSLTNRDMENKFQFASRSSPWPSGYGQVPIFEEEL